MCIRVAKCISCGRKLGLAKTVLAGSIARCESCKTKIEPILLEYERMLDDFSEDRYLSGDEDRILKEFRDKHNIRETDVKKYNLMFSRLKKETRLRNVKLIEDGLCEAGQDGDVSADEHKTIQQLKEKLDLSADEIAQTNRYLFHLTNLSLVEEGILPIVDNPSLSLKKREHCYYRAFARMLVRKKAGWRADRTKGISVRLTKGARYKYGKSRGTRIVDSFTSITDNGYLYLTNKRIVFIGAQRHIEYPIKKLKFFIKYTDCVQFLDKKDKGKVYFHIEDQFTIDELGASLLAIVKHRY